MPGGATDKRNIMKATLEKIVTDPQTWQSHVDPHNAQPESFEEMTLAERIETVAAMWPEDLTDADRAYAAKNS